MTCCRAHHEQHCITMTCASSCAIAVTCDMCYWLYFSLIRLIRLFFFPQASILLQSEENSDIRPEMADEFMHPHTQWILKQPVAKYVLDPHPVYLKHGRPTASSGAAAASGSPSGQSGDASCQGTNTEADTASQREASADTFTPRIPPSAFGATVHQAKFQQPHFTSAKSHRHDAEPSQGVDPSRLDQGGGEAAMPALSGFSASQPMETPAGSEPYTPASMHCCVAPLPAAKQTLTPDAHGMLLWQAQAAYTLLLLVLNPFSRYAWGV